VRAAASFTGTITVSVAYNPNGNCSPFIVKTNIAQGYA